MSFSVVSHELTLQGKAGPQKRRSRRHSSIELFSGDQRALVREYKGPQQQHIEVTWRVDMPGLPEQIQGASPRELFPMGHEDDGKWWVPLHELTKKEIKKEITNNDTSIHTLFAARVKKTPATKSGLLRKISEYFSNQVLHCIVETQAPVAD